MAAALDAASLTSALVRSAKDGPAATLALARGRLEAAGFACGERGDALVARRGAPRLALSGHVDVVPVADGWTRDPFSGEVAEGRVHGRGACDMLGAVACFLVAAASTRAPLAVVLTTDEETTMHAAERIVAEKRLDGIDAVVVGEPTDLEVGSAEKGVLWATITVHGRAAHASMPEKGDNAILGALKVAERLTKLRQSGGHPLLGTPTLAVTGVRGGVAQNVVPDRCEVDLDLRFLPPRRVEEVVSMIKLQLVDAGVRADVEVKSAHPPFEARPDSRLVAALLALRPGAAVGLPYGTEASRFQALGVDLAVFGPGERALAHTNRESVRLDALEAATCAYVSLAETYA